MGKTILESDEKLQTNKQKTISKKKKKHPAQFSKSETKREGMLV